MDTTQSTTKPFKSERAARIAFGKAERAWKTAQSERIAVKNATNEERDAAWSPTAEERVKLDALEAEYKAIEGPARYASEAWISHCDLMNAISDRPLKVAEAREDAAWDAMKAIYDAAKAQGIFIRSYELNYNPTRELIAANID